MSKRYEIGYIFEESELPEVSKFLNEDQTMMSKEYDIITREIEKEDKKEEVEIHRYQIIEIPIEDLENSVRNKRNLYLEKYIDSVSSNPIRWNEFSEEEKQQIINYRRYLLDYPQSSETWYRHNPKTFEDWKDSNK